MAVLEDIAVIHDPQSEEAFHVEQHGVDFIPELNMRWSQPERKSPDTTMGTGQHPYQATAEQEELAQNRDNGRP